MTPKKREGAVTRRRQFGVSFCLDCRRRLTSHDLEAEEFPPHPPEVCGWCSTSPGALPDLRGCVLLAAGVVQSARNEAAPPRPAQGAARVRQARASVAGRAEYREAAAARAKRARMFLANVELVRENPWLEAAVHVAAVS
jgi:hypothetical protein